MDKLHLFLKAWQEHKDPATMLHRGLTLPSAEEVQRILSTKSGQEREVILGRLEEVEGAFARFATNLAEQSKEAKAQIDGSRKAQAACLKYMGTLSSTEDKKK